MNIQDIEILLDRKLDEKLDTKLTEQRKEYERFIGVALEEVRSENKMSFELLSSQVREVKTELSELTEKVGSLQEMVAQNTEDISHNTESITELKDYLKIRVG